MARLTCAYCGNVIKRSDDKCPNCGAETETSIREFAEAREAEVEDHRSLQEGLGKSRRKRVFGLVFAGLALVVLSVLLFMLTSPMTEKIVFFAIMALAYVAFLVMVFEPVLYSEGFQKIVLRPNDSIVGWVAFYISPEADDLELIFADDSVMLKNPAHSDS